MRSGCFLWGRWLLCFYFIWGRFFRLLIVFARRFCLLAMVFMGREKLHEDDDKKKDEAVRRYLPTIMALVKNFCVVKFMWCSLPSLKCASLFSNINRPSLPSLRIMPGVLQIQSSPDPAPCQPRRNASRTADRTMSLTCQIWRHLPTTVQHSWLQGGGGGRG